MRFVRYVGEWEVWKTLGTKKWTELVERQTDENEMDRREK